MPIDAKELEDPTLEFKGNVKRQEHIAKFLSDRPDLAWTARELSEKLEIPVTTVNACLYSLERKGQVKRKTVPRHEGRSLIHWTWNLETEAPEKTAIL